jgi:hypothetical protein
VCEDLNSDALARTSPLSDLPAAMCRTAEQR